MIMLARQRMENKGWDGEHENSLSIKLLLFLARYLIPIFLDDYMTFYCMHAQTNTYNSEVTTSFL